MEAIWNANPNINLLYCFEDGNCFEKLNDAEAYRKTIKADFKAVSRPTDEQVIEEQVIDEQVIEEQVIDEQVIEEQVIEEQVTEEPQPKPTKKSNK